MESFIVSNDHVESNCGTSSSSSSMEPKRKRRRIESQEDADGGGGNQNATVKRWRTEKEQQIYSSKLLQALRHVRSRNQSQTTGRGRDVRETADRVLAVSAKGATRWSRAMLSSSLSLRLKRRHRKVKVAAVIGCNRLKKELKTTEMLNKKKNKKLPVVDMKLRVLGRLIPGCRKASCLNLLEEATDYIAALEMQVRAMAALAEILAAAAQSSPADDRLGANVAS
ncbi:hypothetical protein EZV62_006716 [Acer yangbiense]|uniref:IBH1-like N-terminal domain-containing protein n=1 Tax=Acer yangbiense TaxID=1000413 RepID=A0A5C7I8E6_9ROSI|nr:hypothetical protein EZV62_006716 [Acer yangbiense]